MKSRLLLFSLAIVTIFTQCETIQNLPTNTSGGVFSLNGNWQLATSSDNRAGEGTIINIVPGFTNATVRTLSNNTYCLREGDVVWRNIKSLSGGGFTIENLVNACNNTVYKAANITVISNDEVRVNGHNALSQELVQTWRRVAVSQ
jgi:hypothetical protein